MAIDTALINLQKSKLATFKLNKRDYNLVMITEPYTIRGNVALIDKQAGNVFSARGENPRACIRIRADLNPWLVGEFTSRDICCVAFSVEGRLVYVASVYLDINLPAIPEEVRGLVDSCNRRGLPLLLGMDSNAHSHLWGCEETNARGEALEELIAGRNLTVMNTGTVPTFKTVQYYRRDSC